jgi:phosphohistidine phosphatase
MGRLMKQEQLVPDLVLCSSAQRTRETASLFFAEWTVSPSIVYRDDLYHAEPVQIEGILNSIDNSIEFLMIIGHNPGLEEFLSKHTGKALVMPTAALAQVDFELDLWSHFKDVTRGELINFWSPKDLND